MKRRSIEVESYAGGRADERPRRVILEGREHFVARLLSSSVEEDASTSKQRCRYRILTSEELILEIVRDADGYWYLESGPHSTH